MPPDEPTDEERQEELPGDEGQTPFQPADPSRDDTLPPDHSGQPGAKGQSFDDTHPDTDTDVDKQELYDAGEDAASSGADQPHDDQTVAGYNPPDQPENPS